MSFIPLKGIDVKCQKRLKKFLTQYSNALIDKLVEEIGRKKKEVVFEDNILANIIENGDKQGFNQGITEAQDKLKEFKTI